MDEAFEAAVEAVITGDLAVLERLLLRNPMLVFEHSGREHQATLLHYVAANGVEDERQRTPDNAVEIAELLLEHGADPNATAKFYGGGGGSTPLVALVSSAHPAQARLQVALTELFCKSGALVNGIEDDGIPLATAIAFRYLDAARTLVNYGARVDNPVFAAAMDDLDMLRLFAGGEMPAFIDAFGGIIEDPQAILGAALVAACTADSRSVIEYLLTGGVDVNSRSSTEDSTGLHEAARMNHLELAQLLLDNGADPALSDSQGFTPLHWAAWYGYLEMIDLLLAYSAPLEALTSYEGTVLGTAVWAFCNTMYPPENALDVVERLLNAGANAAAVSPFPCGVEAIDALIAPYRDGAA